MLRIIDESSMVKIPDESLIIEWMKTPDDSAFVEWGFYEFSREYEFNERYVPTSLTPSSHKRFVIHVLLPIRINCSLFRLWSLRRQWQVKKASLQIWLENSVKSMVVAVQTVEEIRPAKH